MRRGFTLIEVLVALTIAAIALMTAVRATGNLTAGSAQLRDRSYAQWSAENRLSQIRVQREFPDAGRREFDCSQGRVVLLCAEEIFATPNPFFRRIEIRVRGRDGHQLASLTGFATRSF